MDCVFQKLWFFSPWQAQKYLPLFHLLLESMFFSSFLLGFYDLQNGHEGWEIAWSFIAMYPHFQYSLDPFTYRAIDYQVFLKLVSRHLEKQQLWKTRNIQIYFPNLKENTKNFGKTPGYFIGNARRNQKKKLPSGKQQLLSTNSPPRACEESVLVVVGVWVRPVSTVAS